MTNALPTTLGLQVAGSAGTTDYQVSLSDSDVTVADVFDALGVPVSGASVDGKLVASPASTRASDVIAPGSRLSALGEHRAAPEPAEIPGAQVEVAIVGGLNAGPLTQLNQGLFRVGEVAGALNSGWYLKIDHPELAESAVKPWHLHGPSVEAIVGNGVAVALGKPVDSERGYGGYVHRPPRPMPPEESEPIELVEAPATVPEPSALSWATLLAPIPIALMMAFFFRPMFALFAAMGPIMALGRWYESKRRFRRDTKKRDAEIAALRAEIERGAVEQAESVAQLRWLTNPHVAELWRRARTNSVRLWERRPAAMGHMVITAGVGPDQMQAITTGAKIDDEIHDLLRAPIALRPVPHVVDLAVNTGVGVHGDRASALAVARSIVLQLATLQGPADLKIGVLCSAEATTEWDWVKWLPHTDPTLTALIANPIAKQVGVVESGHVPTMKFGSDKELGQVRLIIVDDTSADVAAIHRAAQQSDQDVRFVAIAPNPTLLPAACSSLISVQGELAEIATPQLTGLRNTVCPTGVSGATASAWARSMSALVDPEVTEFTAGGDHDVSLLRLVDFVSADTLGARWERRAPDASPTAALGLSDDGPFSIDLTEDGPHILIAGTTGSGKSELLRTLVIALAAECPPEQLNFVLVDFKGGGAFDVVDRLPHVAGLITDLDETMVVRAINSLRAELHRRETLFRDLGVSSYNEAVRCSREPLARLLIVIDEFAALATDYADLMASIIDLAARGRSMGMHLILATQRPSGVVDQKIRANTNLRIALRVQDSFDSQDVIGSGDAAMIDRKAPGRAIFSVGGDTPVTVQTAYSGAPDKRTLRCAVRPHTLFENDAAPLPAPVDDASAAIKTELDVLIEAITTVSAARNYSARPLWSAPLPTTLDWIDLGARELSAEGSLASADISAEGVVLGLADLPDMQAQLPWRWNPDSGALALFGSSAECSGKALVSLGAALASADSPAGTHLYLIDGDAGNLAPLADLAHTGAHITLGDSDRIERAVRMFETALAERRTSTDSDLAPRLVLMIDNIAAVLSMHDELAAAAMIDRLSALARDGASQRLHLVMTARTVRDIGHRLGQHIPNRLVLSLADPNGYLTLGLKSRDVVPLPEMRAMDLATLRVLQLVEPPDLSNRSHDHGVETDLLPGAVRTFPASLGIDELPAASIDAEGEVTVPMGIEAEHLTMTGLSLQPEEHALVIATNGMGRSTALRTIIHQIASASLDVSIVRIAGGRSPLADPALAGVHISDAEQLEASIAEQDGRPVMVFVDDAERADAELVTALEALLAGGEHDVRIIAATTPDFARGIRSWTNPIRTGGIGIVLGGTPTDGDILKARFGRLDGVGVLPGRGHLVARGRVFPTQFAA